MRVAALVLMASLVGCMTNGEDATSGDTARAELRDAGGRIVGRAEARQVEGGVGVSIEASGVSPGTHGVHAHAVGRCDPPGFESAGAHWNPTDREHGAQNPQGPHLGDLPNLTVGSDGRGRLEFRIDGAVLRSSDGLLDSDGAAIVIHATADDYRTDPSGNSGGRIACGVLR
jgi:superoxide dismutase, Cu-Zn family